MPNAVEITTNVSPNFPNEPKNKNYLKPNAFRLIFHRLPNVEYFCQSTNLPKVTLGAAMQPTPFVDVPHAGDKMEFDVLNVTFMVDEDMTNYTELHRWMVGLGFPKSRSQFASLVRDPTVNFFGADKLIETGEYSDASLFILNNNNLPVVEIRFYDAFPVSLEGLDFDLRIPTVDYFTGIASLRYKLYDILPVNGTYNQFE